MRIAFIFLLLVFLFGCQSPAPTLNDNSTAFDEAPNWSKEVIWYQIFVERFRNGDPTNDPTPEDLEGTYPGFVPESWAITPWTQDWYSDDVYFDELEKGKDFYGNPVTSFGQKSQLRRYGGDLQGVLDQLAYFDSLGINAIYFNPLNDAPSLHKYDPRHWRHIDRNFGPSPKEDVQIINTEIPDEPSTWKFTGADKMFLKVIEELHQRDIKVILDYSWNHTGHRFWAWKDVIKKQEASKYKDWYWVQTFDDPATDSNEFEYRGWFGVKDLPEIRETKFLEHNEKLIPDTTGNLYSQEAKNHIFNVTKRWLDPNNDGDPSDGVDGYRLDVAAEMPFGFWRTYRKVVRKVNPDAYLLGEVWWEQWPDKLMNAAPYLRGDIFDSPMNYRWYRSARMFFSGDPEKLSVRDFIDSLKLIQKGIRKSNNYSMMNLNGSHDSPRVLTSLFNKNMYKVHAKPDQDSAYKIHKPDTETINTLKLLLAHQFTYIGSPHIWAGDEMGMWGADDPSCRKPLIWPDYEFEPETTHPMDVARPADEVQFNKDLFTYYQKLIHVRKDNPVLMTGEIEFMSGVGYEDCLVYRRYDIDSEMIVLLNTNNEDQVITTHFNGSYRNLLNDSTIQIQDSIRIPAKTPLLLLPL